MMNRRLISVFLAALIILVTATAAFAQDLTPPGRVDQRSWDPTGNTWSGGTGANKGWWEGETAAMLAQLSTDVGAQYDLPICLQVFELPLKAGQTKAYAFTAFARFNMSFGKLAGTGRTAPTELPNGQAIPATHTGDANVWGYNINIISVTYYGLGGDGCASNEIGAVVKYVRENTDDSYIVWGGHIAKAGDALPSGAPDATVPAGKSAGYVNGTFQARLKTAAADKTLNFKVLYGPNAVVLSGFSAAASAPVFGFVLVGLFVLAGGGVFGWKRLQKR